MRRIAIVERPDWRDRAAESGFHFHTVDGAPYWDESAYYAFSLREIEDDIEAPTEELHAMALDLVDDVVNSELRMRQLAIPEPYWDWIARSWRDRQPHLYGRMDFAYDGNGPAKLYELNYDTPTSLFESAFFQWQWLEDQLTRNRLPTGADQFNSIYESLVEAFGTIARSTARPFLFAAVRDSNEDQGTIAYLRDCALQAGIECDAMAIEDIGITADGRFSDMEDRVIGCLFKLYPLEDMFRETFGRHLPGSGLQLIEPPWKAVLSNKGILPLLWEKHAGHPNLLPAEFDDGGELPRGWVRKPIHSREGANIAMHLPNGEQVSTDGPYRNGPCIRQAYHPLADFDGRHALLGSWVVGDRACGMGIREDRSRVTQDTARFVPHAIVEEPRSVLMA
ncbi:glutathionylspermidine synthase family protein [Dyella subtropica]|uniref:glutathionylspermidine synthase family protein n=1 Tax=Dyella subtropica TaxID=2992127 RepID=UPI002257B067|nr:glutathionylspermidine synthase family protein [Dyella subtropica]